MMSIDWKSKINAEPPDETPKTGPAKNERHGPPTGAQPIVVLGTYIVLVLAWANAVKWLWHLLML